MSSYAPTEAELKRRETTAKETPRIASFLEMVQERTSVLEKSIRDLTISVSVTADDALGAEPLSPSKEELDGKLTRVGRFHQIEASLRRAEESLCELHIAVKRLH